MPSYTKTRTRRDRGGDEIEMTHRHRANEATSAFASTEQSRRFETDPANGDAPSSSDSVTDQSFDNSAPETFVGSNLPAGEEGNSKINFD